MDNNKHNLKGSDSRDTFKHMHKNLNKKFYSLDLDFIWIEKNPPGIVACIDYKRKEDHITFSECIAYNQIMRVFPVYILEDVRGDMVSFNIKKYMGGDWRPEPPQIELKPILTKVTWQEFEQWQMSLRSLYKQGKDLR